MFNKSFFRFAASFVGIISLGLLFFLGLSLYSYASGQSLGAAVASFWGTLVGAR